MESFRTFSSLELVRANACNRYVSIMHSSGMRHHQNLLMAKSHPAGMRVCYAIFAGISLRLCSISHNLRCIPAYTHQIPTGFFQSSLNIHRENLYIMTKNISPASLLRKGRTDYIINAGWRLRLKHAECLSLRYDGNLLLCRLLR